MFANLLLVEKIFKVPYEEVCLLFYVAFCEKLMHVQAVRIHNNNRREKQIAWLQAHPEPSLTPQAPPTPLMYEDVYDSGAEEGERLENKAQKGQQKQQRLNFENLSDVTVASLIELGADHVEWQNSCFSLWIYSGHPLVASMTIITIMRHYLPLSLLISFILFSFLFLFISARLLII